MQMDSPSLCPTAVKWLTPTLEPLPIATIIVRADDEDGTILYQNCTARRILNQSESSLTSLSQWKFQQGEDWETIALQLTVSSNNNDTNGRGGGGGGCPFHRCSTISRTVHIPHQPNDIVQTKQVTIQFQPIQECSCGCSAKYVVAYLKDDQSDHHHYHYHPHSNFVEAQYQRLQATMNASFDAMFTIDEQGIIVMSNQAAVTLFGYDTIDDFIGQNVSILCGSDHAVHHDKYLQQYLQTGIAKIMGKQRRVLARKRNGTEFPIELGIVELPSTTTTTGRYFSAFIRNLSPYEEQEGKILTQIKLTQALMNASFDPMIQIDQKGRIQIVNDATVNLLGYSREELLGTNISILCGGDHGTKHDEYIQRYLETGEKHVIGRKRPTMARRKDGTEFRIELGVKEVQLENGELAFCGFLRDLTAQTKLRESLHRQGQLIHSQFFGDDGSDIGGGGREGSITTSKGERTRRPKRNGNNIGYDIHSAIS